MNYGSRIALAAFMTLAVSGTGQAAPALSPLISSYTVGVDSGLESWVADFDADGIASDQTPRYNVPSFNPAFGIYQGTVAVATLAGYPFLMTYSVQGATDSVGDQVIAHDTLNGEIDMIVNGSIAQKATFSLSLNPSCTASNNGLTIILCSDQQKQTYFSQSIPVVLPAGATVQFAEKLTETNISCVVLFAAGGSNACISGGASITDLNNIQDPQYDGAFYVTYDYIPEPASMSILAIGLSGIMMARRRRLAARR